MKGWIDKTSGETAAHLLSRLQALNDHVFVRLDSGTTIAYSANGLILRQRETVEEKECRGLTEAAAHLLVDLESDTTATAIYYKAVGTNGEYAVVGIQTGSKTVVAVRRSSEGGSHTATITTIAYEAASADGWTTTRPSTAASDGIQTNYQVTTERLYTAVVNATSSPGVAVLCQNCAITTRQYLFLTQQEATEKTASLNAARSGGGYIAIFQYTIGGATTTYSKEVRALTSHLAHMTYVSAERGWTVVDTIREYAPSAVYSNTSLRWHYTDNNGSAVNITTEPAVLVTISQWQETIAGTTIYRWAVLEG